MSNQDENWRTWITDPNLWEKIKPLAREHRHESTPAEAAFWEVVRGRKLSGLKFRRQHPIERFIVDFFCSEITLIIEIDGSIHEQTIEEDKLRQEFLESLGFRVLRFTNEEVLQNVQGVLNKVKDILPHDPQSEIEN
jgi:very-short-patch-repair endonuclease